MKGITFIPKGEVSEEAMNKFREQIRKRDERLKQMAEDFRNGKYDHIIKSL